MLALCMVAMVARADDDLPTRVGRVSELAGELYLASGDSAGEWAPIGRNYPVARPPAIGSDNRGTHTVLPPIPRSQAQAGTRDLPAAPAVPQADSRSHGVAPPQPAVRAPDVVSPPPTVREAAPHAGAKAAPSAPVNPVPGALPSR